MVPGMGTVVESALDLDLTMAMGTATGACVVLEMVIGRVEAMVLELTMGAGSVVLMDMGWVRRVEMEMPTDLVGMLWGRSRTYYDTQFNDQEGSSRRKTKRT